MLIPTSLDSMNWNALLSASVLGFFAFLGFEDMVNVAEEVENGVQQSCHIHQ